jgi:hypothetical protein
MPYRVCVSDGLLRPLPTEVRTRIWLELAQIADMADQFPPPRQPWLRGIGLEPMASRPLPDDYKISYEVNDEARAITLLAVSQPRAAAARANDSVAA